ncbi:thioredoxin-disulfide reductase [Bacteroidales bacterium OttesenSCG-928-K03]|nr:thioredoxin-disulfide reductase [Bacteroidales bacterium OttesenSCG-928-K03]
MEETTKCLIIGSGPAGYTAGIYTSRANLNPILYTGMQMGGQLTITTEIENFPGHPEGISGPVLMAEIEKQAAKFGTDIRFGTIEKVDFSERPFKAYTDDGKTIIAETVIISTGATAKYLGIPSEGKFIGRGVSACATCDGFFYKGMDVAVAGGGDTATEEAIYLSTLCRKVYLIHRRDELRASKIMQKKVFNTPNIEVLWSHTTKEILGDENGVTGAMLHNLKTNTLHQIDIAGFFVAIGHHPNTEIFREFIECDENGYIITAAKSTKTNIPGVFAAGDVQDPNFRQAVTAAGTGCMAAIEAERFMNEIV